MTHAMHKLNPDQLDEPLDEVEGANLPTEQHEAQAEDETEAAVNAAPLADADSAADVITLDDLVSEPTELPALAIPGNLEKLHQRPSADIDDLDGLMQESLQIADDGKRMKDARKRAFGQGSGDLSITDREKLRAEILRWELEAEYKPVAVTTVFRRQQCQCGNSEQHFYGLFVREVKVQDQKIDRLVRWIPQELDGSIDKLPRKFAVLNQAVSFCPECAPVQGFTVAEQLDWEKLA